MDLPWIRGHSVSAEEIAAKTEALTRWPGPGPGSRIPRLLGILRALDLTTLSGDDTVPRVRALCRKAASPLPRELGRRLRLAGPSPTVAAVCIYPAFLPEALKALDGSGVAVATVSAGFPHGLSGLRERIREVEAARETGAGEIDVVIRREWPLTGRWEVLHQEIRELREAAGTAHLKVILGTGELVTLNQVARAALTAMMAGADFVKTSTGKEKVNATLPVGLAMAGAIRDYQERTGQSVGLKPAGGIKNPRQGLEWLRLVETELGPEWTGPALFRIGASSLLDAVLEELQAAPGSASKARPPQR